VLRPPIGQGIVDIVGEETVHGVSTRLEHKGWNVVVVSALNDVHDCTSSGQRRISTPTTA
jgi:hypothetical protein